MRAQHWLTILMLAGSLTAQNAAQDATPPRPAGYTVDAGTKIPLSLLNTVSTKQAQKGDRVYLETAFPVLVNSRIVIPVGSWVLGTVTEVKKPGRAKGRGELYIRFDSLTLPNGVTRDFRARMSGMDASSTGELDRSEGTVKSEGNKKGDVLTTAETAGAGSTIGAIAGNASGHGLAGMGIGAAAGVAGGLIYVLASRGPDATVTKGSTIEMTLDRALSFSEADLNFAAHAARPGAM